ncbi:MAG TPA: DNA recombination protein RmuC [Nocardioidaceae bacterium]|nr:DNA recombination protein RmuC [Nocardioidaceae bacterium]
MQPGIDPATTLSLLVVLLVGMLLGAAGGVLWSRGRVAALRDRAERRALDEAGSRATETAVVRESLERLHDQMRDMAQHGVSWQSQLKQQVEDVRHSTDTLRRETAGLATALRRPQVRGRWGELHLRRVVELAGMVERCDFSEQVSAHADDRRVRPDMVVHLAGGKNVVVDAKVPLDAFLDACEIDDGTDGDARRTEHLRRHARQLRQHVDVLAGKTYWRALGATPEFVVLFVPGESFLSAALEADPTLLEYSADRHVVLATPTTLIALLRTVSYAWTQQTLADKTREIHELGRDVYERLTTMSAHLDRLGRSLNGAVSAYNRAVGSLENRVLVSARRFRDLGVGSDELTAPDPVVDVPRQLTAAELMDRVAEPRSELPELGGEEQSSPPVRRVAP